MATNWAELAKNIDWSDWVSAGQTRNFLIDDPILDWLSEYGFRRDSTTAEWIPNREFCHGFLPDHHPSNTHYLPECDFGKFIVGKGVEFERCVYALIDKIVVDAGPEAPIRVAQGHAEIKDWKCVARTFQLMQQGVPVIYQAVLWDPSTRTFGTPDLLVRSDFLNCIISGSMPVDSENIPATHLGTDFHYVVVEIKYTTLPFDSFGEVGNDKAHHKAQVALYNHALGNLQGYESKFGFIIGRSWKRKDERGNGCFEQIGRFRIEQPQFRKPSIDWFQAALTAAEWVRRVRNEGMNWRVLPSESVSELRPNMANKNDAPFHGAKRKIAEETGEITQLWMVGVDKRNAFVDRHRCNDWKNECCTSAALGLTNAAHDRLEKMLWINRDPDAPLVSPDPVETEREAWMESEGIEFFVDFETCSDLDDDFAALPEKGGNALIFMIGCGHFESGEWKFECFVADRLEPSCEKEIILKWVSHMDAVRDRLAPTCKSPKVFHWSPAEKSTLSEAYNSARSRHGQAWADPNWFDFLGRVVKPRESSDCFVVKGAFGFGLKAIGKALYGHGLIETCWSDGPTDGLGAMAGAWWCYREAARNNTPILNVEALTPKENGQPRKLFQEIRDYNEVDCKVMAECIEFLRSKILIAS